jgi:hypothetical protein
VCSFSLFVFAFFELACVCSAPDAAWIEAQVAEAESVLEQKTDVAMQVKILRVASRSKAPPTHLCMYMCADHRLNVSVNKRQLQNYLTATPPTILCVFVRVFKY